MLKKLFVLTWLGSAGLSAIAAEYYVAPTGQPSGNGSQAQPWDLQTAINRSSPARGGDTIWMRGGTYFGNYISYLGGAANNHITLRGYPQERATIDGANGSAFPLTVDGAWTIYRDFEVIQSSTWVPNAPSPVGIQCVAPNVKLINLVIHDAGQGIGSWMGAYNNEIYGCLIYNNGAKSLEHGIYIQNDAATGIKRVHDNIIFNNSGFGVHGYTQGGKITGFDFQGNIAFNSGSKNGDNTRYENLFVGGGPPSDQINVVSNYTFTTPGLSRYNIRFSYQNHQDEPHGAIVARDNYIVGGTGFTADDWRQITFTNNIVATPSQLTHCWPPPATAISSYLWNNNEYHGASSFGVASSTYNFATWRSTTGLDATSTHSPDMPRGAKIFVRANKYQTKRAHIAIFNWDLQPRVNVDVNGMLVPGDPFEVRNAQDFYGPPVLAGIYNGAPLSLPTTNLSTPLPPGRTVGPQPTGPLFNAYVLIGTPGAVPPPPNNTAPTINALADVTINEDASTAPLPFTIGDAETASTALVVSASSADGSLVAEGNIAIGGSGANRTITLTPTTNRSGSTLVTIVVSDGWLTSSKTFRVTVNPINDSPTISSIPNQTARENSSSAAIPFVIADVDAGANLSVTATSANPTLVANASLVVGGSGLNRTITATPTAGQTGVATITVTVSDGLASASRSFQLTVTPATGSGEMVYVALAADTGSLTAPMGLVSDGNGTYIRSTLFGQGSAAYNFSVSHPGDYIVWCRVLALTSTEDSFLVSVDGGAEDVYDVAEGSWSAQWQWTKVNGRAGGNPLTLNPRVFTLAAGNHTLLLKARDANSRLSRILITNDPDYVPSDSAINYPPTLDPLAPVTISEDSVPRTIALAGISSGHVNEAQTLSLTASSSNPGLIPTPVVAYTSPGSTGTLTVTPAANASGTATITVTVDDGQPQNNVLTRNFVITVSPVNDAPTISNIPDLSTMQGQPIAPITFAITDLETAPAGLVVTATSTDPSLIPTANIALAGTGANRTVGITPTAGRSGAATVTLTVTDGQGGVASDSFLVAVTAAINNPPTLTLPANLSVNEDAALQTVALVGISAGGESQALTVTVTSGNPALIPTPAVSYNSPNPTGTLSFTPVRNASGTATITVTVNDGQAQNNIVTRSFTVTVDPINDLPTITAVGNQTTTVNQPVTGLAFTVGDVESSAVALAVAVSSSNPTLIPSANMVISGAGANRSLSLTPAMGRAGNATITLQVTDGNNGSASTSFNLSVQSINGAPVVDAGSNQVGRAGQPVTLRGAASDDGQPSPLQLLWQKVSGPGTVTFASASTAVTTATFSQAGRYMVSLKATDGAVTVLSTNVVEIGLSSLGQSPRITNVSVNPLDRNGATIRWTTDESANSLVEYGRTTAYGQSTTLSTNLTQSHARQISGLLGETTYHFRIKTRDSAGYLKVSGDYIFTTPRNRDNDGYVPGAPTNVPVPRMVSVTRGTPGTTVVWGSAAAGTSAALQVSTDLVNWTSLKVVVADASGKLRYDDASAGDFPRRFYRYAGL